MGAEKCALYTLIASMSIADLSQFNFALMLFNESPDSSGYPRKAFFHVTEAADKQALQAASVDYFSRTYQAPLSQVT